MRIVDISTHVVGNPWKNWVLVKVRTDDGVIGWGDATQGMASQPAAAAVNEISRLFVGRDPRQIGLNWNEAFRALYLPVNGTLLAALAAIETACWDILGKTLEVPLHQLFGGKTHATIRAYANGWYNGPREPQFVVERAVAVSEMGYTALKIDPFGDGYRVLTDAERSLGMEILTKIRENLSEDVDLIVEVHDRLTTSDAIRLCRDLIDLDPLWVEAPVWSESVRGLRSVAKRVPLRIAGGERFTHPAQFADLLSDRGTDLVLPEYIELGGIERLRQVAAIAAAHEALIAPHNARSMLSSAVNVQVGSTLDNLFIQETFDEFHIPWAQELFEGLPKIADGYYVVPDSPGLGVEINEDLLDAHPYSEHNFLHFFKAGWEQRFST